MLDYTTQTVSAGVDWITVSAEEGRRAELLREYGIELMMADAAKGNKVRPFKRGVYVGGGTKHIGFGEWRGRALVEVTGALADEEWPELWELADRCSRIDVQTSVRQTPYDHGLAIKAWARSLIRARGEGRPPDYDLYARRSQGSTLYIGEGASRYKARMYERWYKDPIEENKDVWRYEVQARRERAVQMAELLHASADPVASAKSLVHAHFSKRGVVPIYDPTTTGEMPPLPQPETDDQRSIRWLSRVMPPIIARLDSHGHGDKWREAVGLPTSDLQTTDNGHMPEAPW